MIASVGGTSPFTASLGRIFNNNTLGKRASLSKDTLKCLAQAGGGGNDGGAAGGGGSSGGGGNNNDDDDEEEFLNLQQAEEMAAAKGIELPEDFAAAARDGGLRKSVLQQYGVIATGSFLTSFLARTVPAFRNRLIADKMYFFKILAEVTIDSACATVAELRKRGDEFWDEFEFYLSDLVVGLVLDVVLVTLLAPVAIPGREKKVAASGIRRWASQLPSGVFEKSTGGRKFSLQDRVGCYVARGLEYSLAGIACGVVGQAVASGMMVAK
jgi:Protein RETICULATA-related